MGEVVKTIFGGSSPVQQAINFNSPAAAAPIAPVAPTPVAPAPARSDAEIQAQAALQRKKYSGFGATPTNLTGGLGVPSSSTYSASAALLGA